MKKQLTSRTVAGNRRRIAQAKNDVTSTMKTAEPGFHGYDFVLLVNVSTGKAEVLEGAPAVAYSNLYKSNPVHKRALAETLKQGVYHYEWNDGLPKNSTWFQTTCVIVPEPGKKVKKIMAFTRDISRWGIGSAEAKELSEKASPKTFSQILLAARELEKKEIFKSLHDEIGSLSVVLMSELRVLRLRVEENDKKRARMQADVLAKEIAACVSRLRGIMVSLRPPVLDHPGGLYGAVQDLLENIGTLFGMPYQFDRDDTEGLVAMSEDVSITLYRIAQECLTNILKHAKAKHIYVSLKHRGRKMYLQVQDDGVGFNPKQSLTLEHVGLLAMKDRAKMLGGTITFHSAPGKGTRVEVVCPRVIYGGKHV